MENNGWSTYEKLVLSKLDELHDTQKEWLAKFEAHELKDAEAFKAIELEMAVGKSAHEATASQKARFWSVIGALCSFVGGVFADWMLFGRGK